MEIALLLYDGLAPLDAVGPYEVMRNVPGWQVRTVAKRNGEVRSEDGSLALLADHSLAEVTAPDLLLVPGGAGNRPLLKDEELLEWLRAVDRSTRWTTSVCTGSLLLGAAGLLAGRRATTNWLALEELRGFGAEPVGGRFVEDGKVVTAAGVTAGIDMALHLVAREAGPEVAQAVQLGIEYDPDPPFDSGSPAKAPAEIVELVRRVAGSTAAGRN
ncbi:MAG TPA: DJ-1/PfpI family protein [Solirubrobacterales bacterium]|nr:DJ-1/PfpI family protein [Solirubrobacterales bacterium]